jgi:lipopolysaccharide export system protein LptC
MSRNDHADYFAPSRKFVSSARINRYSTFVTSMKVVLPSVGAAILLAVFVWSSGSAPPPKTSSGESIDATMRNAVYESRDGNNRPYTLEAPVARQNPDKPDILDLASPTGTIDVGSGNSIKGDARTAVYDQKSGMLNLKGALTLRHSDGTTLTTEGAQVDVNSEHVVGNQPVLLQGSFGEVRGQGIEVKDGGKIVIFKGQSSAKLKMGGGTAAGGPAGKVDSFKGILP